MNDLINRRDAVSRITDLLMLDLEGKRLPTWDEIYNAIQSIDSAEPQRMKGKWITISDGYVDVVKCDQCEKIVDDISNFCPNCGARMENGNGKTD